MTQLFTAQNLEQIYKDIKNKVITSVDKKVFYIFLAKYYEPIEIDKYIERIQNNEVSFDDFLAKMQSLR